MTEFNSCPVVHADKLGTNVCIDNALLQICDDLLWRKPTLKLRFQQTSDLPYSPVPGFEPAVPQIILGGLIQ